MLASGCPSRPHDPRARSHGRRDRPASDMAGPWSSWSHRRAVQSATVLDFTCLPGSAGPAGRGLRAIGAMAEAGAGQSVRWRPGGQPGRVNRRDVFAFHTKRVARPREPRGFRSGTAGRAERTLSSPGRRPNNASSGPSPAVTFGPHARQLRGINGTDRVRAGLWSRHAARRAATARDSDGHPQGNAAKVA